MPFRIIRNDITKVQADAIVNTANPNPVYGRGTDYAIYKAAGMEELLEERKKIGYLRTGEAVATPAFRLPAKYIIHTVGPAWQGGNAGEFEELASCYRKSLLLAGTLGCESIAFPLISTGVYGFPKDQALSIALREISSFLESNEMDVTLVVFNKKAFDLSAELVEDVRQYIDDHYVEVRRKEEYLPEQEAERERRAALSTYLEKEYSAFESGDLFEESPRRRREKSTQSRERKPGEENTLRRTPLKPREKTLLSKRPQKEAAKRPSPAAAGAMAAKPRTLTDIMEHLEESFQERLFRLIDERKLTDAEVYKKANVDRKLFSKIRCNPDYTPKKQTAVALAVALKLSLDETVDLLGRAGLALSPSSKFDLIVRYCIENGIYDIFRVNAILFEYNQPLLGC